MEDTKRRLALACLGCAWAVAGCAVPQRPGNGKVMHLTEATTRVGYFLYLPEDYVKRSGQNPAGGRWPLVVTLHGLRPYDDAGPQIREWQQEADRYNFIVCSPELLTCDTTITVPPMTTADRPCVRRDEKAILAIMDDVCRRTQADPSRVLATSFSSGGYLAHYMVNRHPERFTCIAVRQSNFSSEMLDPTQVQKYRDMKIGIFFGEMDILICREESTEAVAWYRQHRFDVTAKIVSGLGHQRTPQTASVFFADAIGVAPKSPPPLGSLVMHDVMPVGRQIAKVPADMGAARSLSGNGTRTGSNAIYPDASATPGGGDSVASPPPAEVAAKTPVRNTVEPTMPKPVTTGDAASAGPIAKQYQPVARPERRTPSRALPVRSATVARDDGTKVRLNATVGVAPFWVSYTIEMPENVRKGSSILWMDNGRPIGTALSGSCLLRDVGEHKLEALVITADDREIRATETVKVLPKLTTRPAAVAAKG